MISGSISQHLTDKVGSLKSLPLKENLPGPFKYSWQR